MSDKSKFVPVEFPSNSRTKTVTEKTQVSPKKVEKVVSGTVATRKKTLMERFSETFLGDDVNSVKDYVVHDVLIPAAKSTFSDMVSSGIEMLLFGQSRGSRSSRDRGRSHVSYNSISDERRRGGRDISNRDRARHNFDDIIFEDRAEAEEVRSHLVDLVEDYKMASVADLYDLSGIQSNFTDNKYGWTKLNNVRVIRVRDGYMLDLPKPVPID